MNRPAYVLALVAMVVAGGGAALATWSATGELTSSGTDEIFETVSLKAVENGSPRTAMEPAEWRPGMLDEEEALVEFVRGEGYSTISERPRLVRLLETSNGAGREAWAFVVDGNEAQTQARVTDDARSFRIYLYDAHTGEFLLVVDGPPAGSGFER